MENTYGIDWISGHQTNNGRWPVLNDGLVISLDKHGEIQYTTEKSIKLEGSHSTSIRLRITEDLLEISGNVNRYNKSHNAFSVEWSETVQNINKILQLLSSVHIM